MAEPRTGLEYFTEAQVAPEATLGVAWNVFGFFVAPDVSTWQQNTPPSSPAANSWHLVGPSPTGAWSGHAGKLARWENSAWRYVVPMPGMRVRRIEATARHKAGIWAYWDSTDGWYPTWRMWTTEEHFAGRYVGLAGDCETSPAKVWRKCVNVAALPNATVLNVSYGGSLVIDLDYPIEYPAPKVRSTAMGNQLPVPAPIGGLPVDIIPYSASFDIVASVDMSSYAGTFCFEYVKDI